MIRDETREWVKTQPRLQLIAEPEYLNLCIRILPPNLELSTSQWSEIVRNELKKRNLAMVNYSHDQEGTFLRLILANPFLEFAHVQQILLWALEIA